MNERVAGAAKGRLLLRIEDLDQTRSRAQYVSAVEKDLAWLGLRFESPPRRQSEHATDYATALKRLEARRLVYPCFCSRADVARSSQGRDPDGAPLYSGACRALDAEEAARRLARGDKAAWRLDMQRALEFGPACLDWMEFGEGSVGVKRASAPPLWGDVVLRGRDLAASYHLAVTVDDALQGVTDVVRGRDLLAATSVHRLLQELLGLPAPHYRHHRLVLEPSGVKLSKSRQSPSLSDLRASGVTASQVRAALGFGDGDSGGLIVAVS
jgi:glutamyl-Q tRNA(Asp) synthetase